MTAAAAKISSREIVIQKERKVPRDRLKERGYKFSVEPSKQPLHLTKWKHFFLAFGKIISKGENGHRTLSHSTNSI